MASLVENVTVAPVPVDNGLSTTFGYTFGILGGAANTDIISEIDLVPSSDSTTDFGVLLRRYNSAKITAGTLVLVVVPSTTSFHAAATFCDLNSAADTLSAVAGSNTVTLSGSQFTSDFDATRGVEPIIKDGSKRVNTPAVRVAVRTSTNMPTTVVAYLTLQLTVRFEKPSSASFHGAQFGNLTVLT